MWKTTETLKDKNMVPTSAKEMEVEDSYIDEVIITKIKKFLNHKKKDFQTIELFDKKGDIHYWRPTLFTGYEFICQLEDLKIHAFSIVTGKESGQVQEIGAIHTGE